MKHKVYKVSVKQIPCMHIVNVVLHTGRRQGCHVWLYVSTIFNISSSICSFLGFLVIITVNRNDHIQ